MKDAISCHTHGTHEPVMACTHLRCSFPEELFVVPADEEWPIQAWCGACEQARLEDRGWHDAADAMAQWGWICSQCLQEAVSRAGHPTMVAGPAIVTPDEGPAA